MSDDVEALRAELAAMARENRILRASLDRSERNRRRLEDLKDRGETLQRQIIAELRAAQAEVQRANAILEQRVDERTRALSDANEALTRARDAALAASRAKSSFLAVMSHELRTPLNAVLGYGELALDELAAGAIDRDGLGRDLGRILASAQHLLNIIDDVLDLSRIEAGATAIRLEPITLRPLLREVEQTIRPLARKHDDSLTLDVATAPTEILGDRTRLRQILFNLLSNAAKFTRGGHITLRVAAEPGHTRFVVADTGVGIPADALGRVFQPFTQVDGSSTRRFDGTGLGLTLTRTFSHLLGGEIEVESSPGRGSTFTVTLPRCPPRPPALVDPPADDAPAPASAGPPVLVLDDDDEGRAAVLRALRSGGHAATGFADLDAALAQISTLRPAAAVLDVLRADERGFVALQQLAAACPTVVLASLHTEDRCRQLGAAGFLLRPAAVDRLLQQVGAVARP